MRNITDRQTNRTTGSVGLSLFLPTSNRAKKECMYLWRSLTRRSALSHFTMLDELQKPVHLLFLVHQ